MQVTKYQGEAIPINNVMSPGEESKNSSLFILPTSSLPSNPSTPDGCDQAGNIYRPRGSAARGAGGGLQTGPGGKG